MNTPVAVASGYSDKLCGNPLAWRLTDSSCRKIRPHQHDLRSRDIAIENTSAFAAMYPFGESLAFDRATFRACLAAAARIDQHQNATGTFSLVTDVLNELRPRGVVNRLGKHSCRQSFDIQVLHSEMREAVNQRPGQFVREIPPLTSNVGRQSRDTKLRLCAPLAAAPATRNGTLAAAQPLGGGARVLRCRHRLAIGQRHQGREAEVEANRREVPLDRFEWCIFDLEADVPLAARATDHGCANLRPRRQVAMPADFDLSWYAHDADTLALADRQSVANSEVSSIEPGFGTEAREPSLPATPNTTKECQERFIETAQYLLFGTETKSAQPFINLSDGLQFGGLVAITQANPAPMVRFDPLLQGRIIQITEPPKHVGQGTFLRVRREQAKLERAMNRGYGLVSHVEVRSRLVRGAVTVASGGGVSLYTSARVPVTIPYWDI